MNKTVAVHALALASLVGGAMLTARSAAAQATKEGSVQESDEARDFSGVHFHR
jgi:hypothetical protein